MSLDGEHVTPSIDRYQPQHVIGRQHVQLRAPSEHLQQTGNRNQPREDDDIVKMASQVTVDVINSAIRTFAAEQSVSSSAPGNEQQSRLSRDREPAGVASDAVQPPSTKQTSSATFGTRGVEHKQKTGNESADRSTDAAAVSSHHSKPEIAPSSTSGDGPEAEALQDIARLQALTRQLRAAVAESRSADGLPGNVDDNETRISPKDLEQPASQKSTNKENDDMVDCL